MIRRPGWICIQDTPLDGLFLQIILFWSGPSDIYLAFGVSRITTSFDYLIMTIGAVILTRRQSRSYELRRSTYLDQISSAGRSLHRVSTA
ncbi:hypothetical protein BDV37DRAFT_145844 [Aspergillus pseudonomiae]|uniref:Uncharacterized protein n=1 Tax=Aspergillus pseudonomiae TaxID=1506151 RepID=A0A5N7DBZ4_9EURO|nr:uncharacterized protein BDV37DRAFT_145844 [Aspergillus pseudonomiae]KAE8403298.1 hypothetical protein BDV37DRAFT_145844 [Aspergillus pseudonomiae]